MRVIASITAILALASSIAAFQIPAPQPRGRNTHMILGNFFKTPEKSTPTPTPTKATTTKKAAANGRLNLKTIPKTAPKAKSATVSASKGGLASIAAGAFPSLSLGGGNKGKSAVAERPETRVVNGKLKGYFSEEQVVQLEVARREVPSSAPQYWQKIAAKVPGQTPETCKAMVNQLMTDKVRGSKKQFFGGYVEVKETKMVVDTSATPMNRFKEAFGIKK